MLQRKRSVNPNTLLHFFNKEKILLLLQDMIHIDDVYGGKDSDSQRSLIYKVELHEYLINIADRESWIITR